MKAAKLGNTIRKRATYVDKGIGSLLDGYTTTDEFRSILDWFWMENTPAGLRNRAGFTVGHHGLMRGENIRGLELSDLHFVDLENEGPVKDCLAVLCTLNQGKTNQVGRMEYAAFLRNKEADLCPVGGIAFYLFYRYGPTCCFLSRIRARWKAHAYIPDSTWRRSSMLLMIRLSRLSKRDSTGMTSSCFEGRRRNPLPIPRRCHIIRT